MAFFFYRGLRPRRLFVPSVEGRRSAFDSETEVNVYVLSDPLDPGYVEPRARYGLSSFLRDALWSASFVVGVLAVGGLILRGWRVVAG